MNTIPTIFNERKIPYTVLGKSSGDVKTAVSVVVLNRGARYYLSSLFQNLIDLGLSSIVFVDSSPRGFELESLSSQFPEVKFLIPLENVTVGEMINLGISETSSDYVMVFWNDMVLSSSALPENLTDILNQSDVVCLAPVLIDEKNSLIPVQIVPSVTHRDFSTEQFFCRKDLTHTIYMYDFVGIYNREKFIDIGGFDYTIENPYWQNLDFGFRTHLWGMEILISNLYKMKYAGAPPLEDISADNSYINFYLKNLAPLVGKKGGCLPWYLFFSYAVRSGLNPFLAYKHFKAVQDWVHINKYRFVQSPQDLIYKWEPSI
ncbi:hypothetical protein E4O00_06850 [Treponema sp. OMZ 788]|uniref:hypothetical protein n=1 Tax=Treponema sp. OMZ 788 TaxID=2563664 RepID=UPI0020A40D0B|nr:hypothetical protein [Treponema sp. OMZ 788]UTC63677.1 hypothetical protein E4O00_06850 [Treponema sp. OMZ 788]